MVRLELMPWPPSMSFFREITVDFVCFFHVCLEKEKKKKKQNKHACVMRGGYTLYRRL